MAFWGGVAGSVGTFGLCARDFCAVAAAVLKGGHHIEAKELERGNGVADYVVFFLVFVCSSFCLLSTSTASFEISALFGIFLAGCLSHVRDFLGSVARSSGWDSRKQQPGIVLSRINDSMQEMSLHVPRETRPYTYSLLASQPHVSKEAGIELA